MNYDPLDTCPYDPVHRILRSRMQYHLTRCAKNFPCSKKKHCPYDTRHIINQVEYNYHVSTCPGRESVLHYKIIDQEAQEQQKILPIETQPIAAAEEDWDDSEVQTYDPQKNALERQVVRTFIGGSKSQKKKFRMEERLRHQRLENEKIVSNKIQEETRADSLSVHFKSKPEIYLNDEQIEQGKPLRPPKSCQSNKLNENESGNIDQIQKDTKQDTSAQLKLNKTTLNSVASINNLPEKQYSNHKENNSVPKTVPFSYAAALKRNSSKTSSSNSSVDNDSDFTKDMQFDVPKENINTSLLNCSIDNSIFEKLSRTVEEIAIDDEGHKKKTEPLNKEIETLKNSKINKKLPKHNSQTNNEKKLPRCAANFSNLK